MHRRRSPPLQGHMAADARSAVIAPRGNDGFRGDAAQGQDIRIDRVPCAFAQLCNHRPSQGAGLEASPGALRLCRRWHRHHQNRISPQPCGGMRIVEPCTPPALVCIPARRFQGLCLREQHAQDSGTIAHKLAQKEAQPPVRFLVAMVFPMQHRLTCGAPVPGARPHRPAAHGGGNGTGWPVPEQFDASRAQHGVRLVTPRAAPGERDQANRMAHLPHQQKGTRRHSMTPARMTGLGASESAQANTCAAICDVGNHRAMLSRDSLQRSASHRMCTSISRFSFLRRSCA